MTGNFAPDWLYADKEAGGGGLTPILIKTDGQGTQKFPPYLDQRYQAYFLRAIDRFAEHISSLPDAVRSKVQILTEAEESRRHLGLFGPHLG